MYLKDFVEQKLTNENKVYEDIFIVQFFKMA